MYIGSEQSQSDNFSGLLRPLLRGQPVTLKVSDPKAKIKNRIGKPILFITPAQLYGLDKDALVFALQGQGCEVMQKSKLKAAYFVRMGLSMVATRSLIIELNLLFNQEETKDGKDKG